MPFIDAATQGMETPFALAIDENKSEGGQVLIVSPGITRDFQYVVVHKLDVATWEGKLLAIPPRLPWDLSSLRHHTVARLPDGRIVCNISAWESEGLYPFGRNT